MADYASNFLIFVRLDKTAECDKTDRENRRSYYRALQCEQCGRSVTKTTCNSSKIQMHGIHYVY